MAVPSTEVLLISVDGFSTYDVTSYVKSISTDRGRSRELDRFEAGTFSIAFENRNRVFDPLNTSSPFNGLIVPNVGVQITTEGVGRIYGFIKDWNLMYDVSGESTAVATGTDAFSFLANQTTSASLSPAEQTAGNRIGYVLGQPDVEWPYGGPNWVLDTTGTMLVQSHTIDAGTNILEYAQLVERTEGGYFFVNQTGVIEFQKNSYELVNNVVFTDDNTDIPYQGVEIIYGSELLYNTINLTRLGGAKKTVSRPVSIAAYGNSVYEDDGLLYVDDTATQNAAEVLAAKYSEPEYRFDTVTVFLNPLNNAKQQRVLGIDLAQIITIKFRPNNTGSRITKFARVIGVSEKIDIDGHTITFKLATIENEVLTLDGDVFGLLDYNVLGF
jgi:hypothetical protein